MNCVFPDDNRITVDDNMLIAPGVHIYTVFHPGSANEKLNKSVNENFPFAVSKTTTVSIGNNVWINGGSIIFPCVTIGAGSIVTQSSF
ncbi:MAG: hypothetical protein FWF54_09745 [Candidatus Azobacteroides sp.]|nr:hypothetical protein [Candidatus Azobacteroides sp.]